jgi:hypothetical protein
MGNKAYWLLALCFAGALAFGGISAPHPAKFKEQYER